MSQESCFDTPSTGSNIKMNEPAQKNNVIYNTGGRTHRFAPTNAAIKIPTTKTTLQTMVNHDKS